MKGFLLATTAFAAFGIATQASAADLPARPYTKAAPMIAAIYDWSGFYIGANGGWGSSRNCWDAFFDGVFVGSDGCHDATGGVVGGQIGYRWQASNWVFGVEAQGDWANLRGSNITLIDPAFSIHSRIDAFGLFTGQVGYAWNNALLYVKGGAAVIDNRFEFRDLAGVVQGSSGDQSRWGATVGAGVEYGFAQNWSAGIEYDHLFMGNKTVTFTDPAGAFFATERIKQDVDLVTVRINYRWGGPTIAKY